MKSKSGVDPTGYSLSFSIAFRLLLACRLLAAYYSNISDCDEVFNYWEATHYLLKGTGFQTWEYSPTYMIRSWVYPVLNTIPIGFIHLIYRNKVDFLSILITRFPYSSYTASFWRPSRQDVMRSYIKGSHNILIPISPATFF
jgi:alpha-1,2-mannosyltransferase